MQTGGLASALLGDLLLHLVEGSSHCTLEIIEIPLDRLPKAVLQNAGVRECENPFDHILCG